MQHKFSYSDSCLHNTAFLLSLSDSAEFRGWIMAQLSGAQHVESENRALQERRQLEDDDMSCHSLGCITQSGEMGTIPLS